MASSNFDAADVEDLTYDFTKYAPGVQGTIPEPTSDQIEKLVEILRRVFPTKVNEKTGKTEIDVSKINDQVAEGSDQEGLLYAALADFTSDQPSVEDIKALPFRPQRRFVGWLIGQFFSPEA